MLEEAKVVDNFVEEIVELDAMTREEELEVAKVVEGLVDDIVEFDTAMCDEELEVIVAEADVGRVSELEELFLADVVVEDTEDEVVFALV